MRMFFSRRFITSLEPRLAVIYASWAIGDGIE